MTESKVQNNRIGHIDSIRGIAALLVVWIHTTAIFKGLQSPDGDGLLLYDIAAQFQVGRIGVVAFFAISGFVICPSLKGGRITGSGKFVISRFFRLYPAFWTSMICAILVLFVLQGREIDEVQVLGNIPMLYSLSHVEPLEGLYWTLEVELVFYILCLGMFLIGWLHKPLAILGLCACFMYVQHLISNDAALRLHIKEMFNLNWVQLPWHIAIMFWGGLFRIWYDSPRGVVTLWRFRVPNLFFVVAALLLILLQPVKVMDQVIQNGGSLRQYAGMLAYILGILLFIAGALWFRINHPFFVWLGAISYSLYLLHPLVAHVLCIAIKRHLPEYADLHLGVSLVLSSFLSVVMSACVYYLVEKPSIRLGRKLQQLWFAPDRHGKPEVINVMHG